jgi:hypothetical protein
LNGGYDVEQAVGWQSFLDLVEIAVSIDDGLNVGAGCP